MPLLTTFLEQHSGPSVNEPHFGTADWFVNGFEAEASSAVGQGGANPPRSISRTHSLPPASTQMALQKDRRGGFEGIPGPGPSALHPPAFGGGDAGNEVLSGGLGEDPEASPEASPEPQGEQGRKKRAREETPPATRRSARVTAPKHVEPEGPVGGKRQKTNRPRSQGKRREVVDSEEDEDEDEQDPLAQMMIDQVQVYKKFVRPAILFVETKTNYGISKLYRTTPR